MSSIYSVITDDFLDELGSVEELIDAFDRSGASVKTRVASINSSVLLLAATFEEYVREMAREYAKWVVSKADNVERLPRLLTETAWRKTLEDMARRKLRTNGVSNLEMVSRESRSKFDAICGFISGDLSQEIFDSLIHNENNMRAGEINSMFKVSGLKNICTKICDEDELQHFFGETDAGKAHGLFCEHNDKFFERRNSIAHSLNAGSSVAPDTVRTDIAFFRATAQSLTGLLEDIFAEEATEAEQGG